MKITLRVPADMLALIIDGLGEAADVFANPGWCYGCDTTAHSEICDEHAQELELAWKYRDCRDEIAILIDRAAKLRARRPRQPHGTRR